MPLAASPGGRPRLWIFDLDNTLHDATPHIFPHINRAMTEYIQNHLGLGETAADLLRVDYWHRYGATMLGLMKHHGTDPGHFLWHAHQFPELDRMLVFEKTLKSVLRRLPGRKLIFSNAPRHYADAVLCRTGLAPLFDAVYAIEQVRFRPKPDVSGFLRILRRERVAAVDAVMVEDSLVNLVTAKRLGMKTVWISSSTRRPAWVDVVLRSVRHLPRSLGRL